jgi:hypothetical protein
VSQASGCCLTAGAIYVVTLSSHTCKLVATFFLVCFNIPEHLIRREDGADTETKGVA